LRDDTRKRPHLSKGIPSWRLRRVRTPKLLSAQPSLGCNSDARATMSSVRACGTAHLSTIVLGRERPRTTAACKPARANRWPRDRSAPRQAIARVSASMGYPRAMLHARSSASRAGAVHESRARERVCFQHVRRARTTAACTSWQATMRDDGSERVRAHRQQLLAGRQRCDERGGARGERREARGERREERQAVSAPARRTRPRGHARRGG
jgi:hypothetical protein